MESESPTFFHVFFIVILPCSVIIYTFLCFLFLFCFVCCFSSSSCMLLSYFMFKSVYLVGIYLLKVNNRNTRVRCGICSKLIIKTPERRHWYRSGVFIVNFEHISQLVLVFLLLTLNMQLPAGYDPNKSENPRNTRCKPYLDC